nr:hypothetical protein CFP56_10330 [Quercus suber]
MGRSKASRDEYNRRFMSRKERSSREGGGGRGVQEIRDYATVWLVGEEKSYHVTCFSEPEVRRFEKSSQEETHGDSVVEGTAYLCLNTSVTEMNDRLGTLKRHGFAVI